MYTYVYTCTYLHVYIGINVHSDAYVDATLLTRAHTTPHCSYAHTLRTHTVPRVHTHAHLYQHSNIHLEQCEGSSSWFGAMERRHMHVCYRRTCMCHRYTCLCHMHTCMCYRHTCIKVYTPTPTRTYTPCNTQIGVDTLMTRTDSDDKEIGVDTLITRKHHKEAGVDTLITRKHFLRGTRERALVCLESTYLYQHTHIRCKTRQHLRIGTRLALAWH